jgi:hypothetical protein
MAEKLKKQITILKVVSILLIRAVCIYEVDGFICRVSDGQSYVNIKNCSVNLFCDHVRYRCNIYIYTRLTPS